MNIECRILNVEVKPVLKENVERVLQHSTFNIQYSIFLIVFKKRLHLLMQPFAQRHHW